MVYLALYTTECVSHSPVYLPKQACNMVTPSLLLLVAPGHDNAPGLFTPQTPSETQAV